MAILIDSHSQHLSTVLAALEEVRGNRDSVDHDGIARSGCCGGTVCGGDRLALVCGDQVLACLTTTDDLGPLTRSCEHFAAERPPHDTVVEPDPVADPGEPLDHDDLAGRSLGDARQ